jgi:hypothetical protein
MTWGNPTSLAGLGSKRAGLHLHEARGCNTCLAEALEVLALSFSTRVQEGQLREGILTLMISSRCSSLAVEVWEVQDLATKTSFRIRREDAAKVEGACILEAQVVAG